MAADCKTGRQYYWKGQEDFETAGAQQIRATGGVGGASDLGLEILTPLFESAFWRPEHRLGLELICNASRSTSSSLHPKSELRSLTVAAKSGVTRARRIHGGQIYRLCGERIFAVIAVRGTNIKCRGIFYLTIHSTWSSRGCSEGDVGVDGTRLDF